MMSSPLSSSFEETSGVDGRRRFDHLYHLAHLLLMREGHIHIASHTGLQVRFDRRIEALLFHSKLQSLRAKLAKLAVAGEIRLTA